VKTVTLFDDELAELPEYSCSLPTGTTIGKRWKRDRNFGLPTREKSWCVAEYVAHEDPKMVGIEWREVEDVLPRAEWVDLTPQPREWRIWVEVFKLPRVLRIDPETHHITGKRCWVPAWVEELCEVLVSCKEPRRRSFLKLAARLHVSCSAAYRIGGVRAMGALLAREFNRDQATA
jgi:hypothetical protein